MKLTFVLACALLTLSMGHLAFADCNFRALGEAKNLPFAIKKNTSLNIQKNDFGRVSEVAIGDIKFGKSPGTDVEDAGTNQYRLTYTDKLRRDHQFELTVVPTRGAATLRDSETGKTVAKFAGAPQGEN